MSSKFLQIIPLKSKTGKAVTSAFQTILKDAKYLKPIRRRPVWVRTDREKEFLNKSFQDMLKREGIQFQIWKTPMSNAQSWRGLIALSGISYTNTSHIRTRTDLLSYCQPLCEGITRRFTVQLACLQHDLQILIFWLYGREWTRSKARFLLQTLDFA